MTTIYVHGAPNTARMWEPLLAALGRTSRAPWTCPDSGSRPPRASASRAGAYKDWLIGEIEREDGPVHLVAHDQDAIIGQGLLVERPDLVASFVFGGAVADDDYHRHTEARVFQTAALGERSVAAMAAMTIEDRAPMLESYGGAPPEYSEEIARGMEGMDGLMYEAMLRLYRSEPSMADWAIDPDKTYPPGPHRLGQPGSRAGRPNLRPPRRRGLRRPLRRDRLRPFLDARTASGVGEPHPLLLGTARLQQAGMIPATFPSGRDLAKNLATPARSRAWQKAHSRFSRRNHEILRTGRKP